MPEAATSSRGEDDYMHARRRHVSHGMELNVDSLLEIGAASGRRSSKRPDAKQWYL